VKQVTIMKSACKNNVRKRENEACRANVVHNPPCNLQEIVLFTGGLCPLTGETSCEECISCEFDADCIRYLVTTERFGLA